MLLCCDLVLGGNRWSKRLRSCSVLYHCVMLKKPTAQQASIVKLLGHFCTIYRTPVERILRIPSSDDAPVPAGKTTVPKTLSFLPPFFLWGCQGWALTTGYHFNGKSRDHFNIVGFQVVELLALEGQYWRTKPLQKAILSSEEDQLNAGVFDEYYIPLWNTAAPCPRDSFGKPFFYLPATLQCLQKGYSMSFSKCALFFFFQRALLGDNVPYYFQEQKNWYSLFSIIISWFVCFCVCVWFFVSVFAFFVCLFCLFFGWLGGKCS